MTENLTYRRLSDGEYADLQGRILYEDNHLLIVCKKPGEIVQGDKTGDETLGEKYQAFIAARDAKPGKGFLRAPQAGQAGERGDHIRENLEGAGEDGGDVQGRTGAQDLLGAGMRGAGKERGPAGELAR